MICSNNHLGEEMTNQMEDSGNDKSKTVEKIDETVSMQKERSRKNSHMSITGRPNIDEISKRNEEEIKRERKSFYTVAGIIILFIVIVVVLIYFFS